MTQSGLFVLSRCSFFVTSKIAIGFELTATGLVLQACAEASGDAAVLQFPVFGGAGSVMIEARWWRRALP
jgi:hypothetical protein